MRSSFLSHVLGLSLCLGVSAQVFGGPVVDWSSVEGMRRLERSASKMDFFPLANNFQAQTDKLTCGPTTGAVVLNALRANTPKAPLVVLAGKYRKYLPKGLEPGMRRYTPESFFTEAVDKIKTKTEVYGKPLNGKSDYGIQLRQLHQMFLAHEVKSVIRVADAALSDNDIKAELKHSLSSKGNFVIVNFSRKALGQVGGGHISPLGAYDEVSDSFLLLDVNPATANWGWVESADLIRAMRTLDTTENRGYLLISE